MITHRLAAAVMALAVAVRASRNGLGITPQMGWNTWNAFGCNVDADLLTESTDLLVSMGFRDAGYTVLSLDDCWQAPQRDQISKRLSANATRFPNGISAVSDYAHAHGLKFGIYSTAGVWTCAKYPASLDYEEIDANTFADWGVDYLKYDNCFNQGRSGTPQITFDRYNAMSEALNKTNRPIFYSLCNWGEDYPWKWAQPIANSWRISGDITDSFSRPDPRCPCTGDEGYDCALAGFHCSAMNILNKQASYPDKGFPGGWNDLDGLEVGNGGMTDSEYVAHFTMWALVKSPLLMGNDLRSLDAKAISILSNPAVIAVSQDSAGVAVVRRWRNTVSEDAKDEYGQGDLSLWSGQLANGDYAVALLNTGTKDQNAQATLRDIFVDEGGLNSDQAKNSWEMRDLWGNRMPEAVAQQIRDANATTSVANIQQYQWNATAKSYADGVAAGEEVLLGSKNGTVQALGSFNATVPARSVRAWRLRNMSNNKRSEL